MDAELRIIVALTRHLPRWKGAGRIPIWLRRWYLRKPRLPVEIDVSGSLMRLSPEQFVDGWLLFGPQFYEAQELQALMKYVKRGDVFVDIGAHIGLYAIQAALRVGDEGLVVAIEPNLKSVGELRHNIALNGIRNVRVVASAAAGSAGMRELAETSPTNRAGATLLSGGHQVTTTVAGRPLAEILRSEGVSRVDVVKMDIEGSEHEVLSRYFADVPRPDWPSVIMTEHYEPFAAHAGDALILLRQAGYESRYTFGANYVFVMPGRRSRMPCSKARSL